ncbi:MAG: C40 family peptidase [Eisenbergiella sp.]
MCQSRKRTDGKTEATSQSGPPKKNYRDKKRRRIEKGREIADFALLVGNPYVWGGTSLTNGADCSGFVQSVYKNFGISIPRTSAEQSKFGKKVSFEDLQPGDLVFYAGHVVMSIGDGRIVHASSAKEGIKVGNDVTYRTILDIRRPWET